MEEKNLIPEQPVTIEPDENHDSTERGEEE